MISLRQDEPSPRENVVPMINVAFLLLVFFLMTAVISPTPPTELEVPLATNTTERDGLDVFLLSDGRLAMPSGAEVGDEDFEGQVLRVNVDAGTSAGALAKVLTRLRLSDPASISIVTRRR